MPKILPFLFIWLFALSSWGAVGGGGSGGGSATNAQPPSQYLSNLANNAFITITNANVLYVSTGGNNTTATKNRPDKPWREFTNAVYNASAGDIIMVGPGRWTNNTTVLLSNRVSVVGAGLGLTVFTNTVSIASSGVGLQPSLNGSYLSDFSIHSGDPGDEVLRGPIGVGDAGLGNGKGFTNSTWNNLEIIGWSDAIYINNTNPCSFRAFNCVFKSNVDALVQAGTNGHRSEFYNCQFITTSTVDSTGDFVPVRVQNGISTFQDCLMVTSNGASHISLFVDTGAIAYLYNTRIPTFIAADNQITNNGTVYIDHPSSVNPKLLKGAGTYTYLNRNVFIPPGGSNILAGTLHFAGGLGASSLLSTTSGTNATTIPNGTGMLTNDGAGVIGYMAIPAGGGGEANVNGETSVTNSTRMGLVAGKSGVTNLLRSVQGGNGIVTTNQGTNIMFAIDPSVVSSPGGAQPMLQMTLGGAFTGTTNLTYDNTNMAIGLGIAGARPRTRLEIGDTGSGNLTAITVGSTLNGPSTNFISAYSFTSSDAVVFRAKASALATASVDTNSFYPGQTNHTDLGLWELPWRTNHSIVVRAKSSVQVDGVPGASPGFVILPATNQTQQAVVQAAHQMSVNVTNVWGLLHKSSASVIEHNANQFHRLTVTNRLTAATSLILTNTSDGQLLSGVIPGEVSGGTSRTLAFIPNTGQLVACLDDFGTALATSYTITVTNGNAVAYSDEILRVNGTNIHHIVTRQFKH